MVNERRRKATLKTIHRIVEVCEHHRHGKSEAEAKKCADEYIKKYTIGDLAEIGYALRWDRVSSDLRGAGYA